MYSILIELCDIVESKMFPCLAAVGVEMEFVKTDCKTRLMSEL